MKNLNILIAGVVTLLPALIFSQQRPDLMPPMVHVEGGTFLMGNSKGSADEQPAHNVTLTSFYFGKFEVTLQDFKKFVDATGYVTDAEQPDSVLYKHGLPPRGKNNGTWKIDSKGMPVPSTDSLKPVGNISWRDANAYLDWLGKMTGKKFRLPTEAEWEYAARGGNKSKGYTYAGSNNLDEVAWYVENSYMTSHSIGQKLPNELGIYDMTGNSREWCSDWYGESYYKISPADNPQGPEFGKNRVLRGGSWTSNQERMRLTYRNEAYPYNSALDFGFRPAFTDEEAVKAAATPPPDVMKDFDATGSVDIYGIYFDINKADIKPESYQVIDQIEKYLRSNPTVRIVIEGHTDNTGSDRINQPLSENRAKSIREALIRKGIDPDRLEAAGYGSSKPVADNSTSEGRTLNRRVTIKKR